ncbi:MAG TPA: MFS transporter [Pseudonocardiaceae bacterium]|nr:MFS transporter [Pseudonocardiaceae bacterium]
MVVTERWWWRGGLLRHRDFRHLCAAEAISKVGTGISSLAVPLLAVITLHASTFEVSTLKTLQTVAYLLIGLQAGAWCDRMRCRPVLVVADLGRAITFGSIPIAAVFGAVTLWQLYLVMLVTGILTVFFDVAHQSYLPRLIERDDLIEGNAKLRTGISMSALAAPSLAGYLVQRFTASIAILVDALSFLCSATWLQTIRSKEAAPKKRAEPQLRQEILEGTRLVFGNPILRAIGLNNAITSLCQTAHLAIVVVFLIRVVHLSPSTIGLLGSLSLVGALVGAVLARRLATQVGAGRLLWITALINGLASLGFPLTDSGWRLVYYVVAGFVTSACLLVVIVVQVSLQQTLCPDHLLGRMNATINFLYWGAAPVGSLLAGVVAEWIGLRPTLWLAAVGMLLAAGVLIASPLPTMRHLPREGFPVAEYAR